jgi:hypothetical protein
MKKAVLLAAPQIDGNPPAANKWEREYRAFLRLRPSLLRKYRDKYVAVHEEKVVASGEDKIALALQVYSKYGYVPIYVGRVSVEPEVPARIPSPRRVVPHPIS